MKLQEAEITNFRSIAKTKIRLEPEITVLVGKNEAGKSNVLLALSKLHPGNKIQKNDARLESQLGKDVLRQKTESSLLRENVVLGKFELDVQDRKKLADIVKGVLQGSKKLIEEKEVKYLTVTRNFNNEFTVLFENNFIQSLLMDIYNELGTQVLDIAIKKPFASKFDIIRGKFTFDSKSANEKIILIKNTIKDCEQVVSEFLIEDYYDIDSHPPSKEILRSLEKIELRIIALEDLTPNKLIGDLIPKIVYVSAWEMLQDSVGLSELISNPKPYKTINNLLRLADISADTLMKATDNLGRDQLLNQAGKQITDKLKKLWKQEGVSLKLLISENILSIYLEDEKSGELIPPSQRSPGIQTFLSFYLNYAAGAEGDLKRSILLFDDAGTYLHPSGQRNLLEVIEGYSKDIQVVFTTHYSPLIDLSHFERIRLVQREKTGSIVIDNFRQVKTDSDALKPIRQAIGSTLGDNLLLSKTNVLVEGFSDVIILQELLNRILEEGKKDELMVWPAGGATKIYPYAFMLWKENLGVLVLLDNDSKGREAGNRIKNNGFPEEKILYTSDLIGKNEYDSTIEDVFEFEIIKKALEMYKKEYNLEIKEITELERPFLAKLTKIFKESENSLDKVKFSMMLVKAFEMSEENIQNTVLKRLQVIVSKIKN